MNFGIKWHPQALKALKRLPKDMIARVLEKVDETGKDPFRFLEHYEGGEFYKLRIVEYRALIEVDFKSKLLMVKVFDHRKRIYNR